MAFAEDRDFLRMAERASVFVRTAGTLILAVAVDRLGGPLLSRTIRTGDSETAFWARMGRVIEPVVRPLGWDWRIGCAVIASFPAREVVVATLGVVYNPDTKGEAETGDGGSQLQTALRRATWEGTNRPVFTMPVALSILVFFALCRSARRRWR